MKTCKPPSKWRFNTGEFIVEAIKGIGNRATFGLKIVARGPFVKDKVGIVDSYVVQHGGNLMVLSREEVDKNYKVAI